MKTRILVSCLIPLLIGYTATAEQAETFDYFKQNRKLVRNGVQAMLQCNGL